MTIFHYSESQRSWDVIVGMQHRDVALFVSVDETSFGPEGR